MDRPVITRSNRSVVYGTNGMVACSQPLAAAAGLRVLMAGGNAIDAAISMAAVLSVVEPFMTGPGGDIFTLVYNARRRELKGLNGSGRSPYGLNLTNLRQKGFTRMPERGVHTITVPGAVDGWFALLERYGSKPMAQLLEPSLIYAKEGFPVSEIISSQWHRHAVHITPYPESVKNYLPDGRAPLPGQIFRQPNMAATLRKIAEDGRDAFYEGEIAERIVKYCKSYGGTLSMQDFQDHRSEWVDPISTLYKGYQVFEMPPNSQGLCVLQMLNILAEYDLINMGHNSVDYLHLLIEAKKLAFACRQKFVSDPDFNQIPTNQLISQEYAAHLRKQISMDKVIEHADPGPSGSDTVYLCTVDKDGNCVSFINSIFHPFGSGMVAGDTGIILQGRGSAFSFQEDHYNKLEPHKRPLHTIIPAMVFKDGNPFLSYGVMGADMQPQGHVQVLLNILHFGLNIQEAGEAARVCHSAEGVALESQIPWETRYALLCKGHKIISQLDVFGGYQGILIDPETGVLQGGSDPRKDGYALGY